MPTLSSWCSPHPTPPPIRSTHPRSNLTGASSQSATSFFPSKELSDPLSHLSDPNPKGEYNESSRKEYRSLYPSVPGLQPRASPGRPELAWTPWGGPGLQLRFLGSRVQARVMAHGLCCSTACEIFPDQGSILCFLYWSADFCFYRNNPNAQQKRTAYIKLQ